MYVRMDGQPGKRKNPIRTTNRFKYNLWISHTGHAAVVALATKHGLPTSEVYRRLFTCGLRHIKPEDLRTAPDIAEPP